jgi:hypothetical protein
MDEADAATWGAFRDRVEVDGSVAADGDVLGAFFGLYDYASAPSVRFDWDSWARCYINCDHGEWYHDSHLLNFTEAFVKAKREWLAGSEHPTTSEEEATDNGGQGVPDVAG